MNSENKDHMKNDGAWEAVHDAFNTEVPEHLEKQLKKNLNAFRQDMREHPYVRRPERPGFPLWRKLFFFARPWFRPLLLTGMGLAVVVIVGSFILGNNPPTWAEVQERFGSMPFFAASMGKLSWSSPSVIRIMSLYSRLCLSKISSVALRIASPIIVPPLLLLSVDMSAKAILRKA